MSIKDKEAATEKQEWYTPTEAAQYLRVTRQAIYKYMADGLLTYFVLRSGGGRRLRRADLDALLEPPSDRPPTHSKSS